MVERLAKTLIVILIILNLTVSLIILVSLCKQTDSMQKIADDQRKMIDYCLE